MNFDFTFNQFEVCRFRECVNVDRETSPIVNRVAIGRFQNEARC